MPPAPLLPRCAAAIRTEVSVLSRRMPAEWEPHARTWMAFPPPSATFGPEGSQTLGAARSAWAGVARLVAGYEPVTLVAHPGQGAVAARLAGPGVRVVERELDDAWIRDTGPTFTIEDGTRLGAVDWVFNGWGAQDWATWEADAGLGADLAVQAGATPRRSALTNEGGGFHVDGAGTVLLTETVQLDPRRNPGWSREQVGAEIHAQLGTRHAVWLPRGLTADYHRLGTRGHIDIVAAFTPTGPIAVHAQPDPTHPDHAVSHELTALLGASRDAAGRPLHVVEIPAPAVLLDGQPTSYSYINHYVGNGFVLVGTFDDPADQRALDLLARLYPGRRVETVDGRAVFAYGGGVHCITQQQPRVTR
ncbi:MULTISPECIES: agmatine deiminase family protein [unclassified Frankia]|uniref:agmatine deiminase family protein n=1 Tax=unclassified Frankia TaxID=2632575 RepID=UPI004044AF9A